MKQPFETTVETEDPIPRSHTFGQAILMVQHGPARGVIHQAWRLSGKLTLDKSDHPTAPIGKFREGISPHGLAVLQRLKDRAH